MATQLKRSTAKKASVVNDPHVESFLSNIREVEQLLKIHSSYVGNGPGRKRDVEVLNKSAIVLTVACWEAYVEDISTLALDYMIANAASHLVFPEKVLKLVAANNSGVSAWSLAGEGWKIALRNNYDAILAKTAAKLNTPRAAQVDELFANSIGLEGVSRCWHWKGRSVTAAVEALDDLVTLRGGIAHRVKHSRSVLKRDVTDATNLVLWLAAKTTNRVRTHVHSSVGSYPWRIVAYRGAT
ncbi:HEPN domain-containing protein [Lysobacter sp. Root667]|uniref:HEPN domain-containing protein n=1 Tax=Lysobacter sp. Root667 TaxID=1736581 RepID=UPI0012DED9DF|nr:HEPN domain-containing protein [Lysobacter sp. Root667]